MSVEFDFNAQLKKGKLGSNIASVDLIRMEKGSLFTHIICALFLLCLPLRVSSVSVVFVFNASLIDVAPV